MQKRKACWDRYIGTLLCLAFFHVAIANIAAQTNSSEVAYVLLSGSQLLDDCPICDHISVPVPMYGTFQLRLQDATPLYGTYDLLNILFHTDTNSGRQFTVNGEGTYQYGGAKGAIQNALLNVNVGDGFTDIECDCTNTVHNTGISWPEIEIEADQTNGTAARVFHLKIVAIPAPKFTSIIANPSQGTIRLEWTASGQQAQVEKADNAGGPYNALSSVTTNEFFTEIGSPTNRLQAYYRLRLW